MTERIRQLVAARSPRPRLLATLVLLAGLSMPVPASHFGRQGRVAAPDALWEGWKLELRMDRRVYDAGEPVLLRTILKNDFKADVEVRNIDADRNHRVVLSGPSGIRVPLTEVGRQVESDYDLVGPIQTVPAQGLESEIDLAARYDLSARGEYRVRVQRRVPSLDLRTARLIDSSEVRFVVRAGVTPSRALPSKPAPEMQWGDVTEGIQISAEAPKGEFQPREPIDLIVSMRNASDRLLKYVAASPTDLYRFTVVDAAGRPAEPTPFYRDFLPGGSRFSQAFFPGERTKDRVDLRELYKLDRPGTYTVTVTRRVATRDGTWVDAAAKPLRIVVRGGN